MQNANGLDSGDILGGSRSDLTYLAFFYTEGWILAAGVRFVLIWTKRGKLLSESALKRRPAIAELLAGNQNLKSQRNKHTRAQAASHLRGLCDGQSSHTQCHEHVKYLKHSQPDHMRGAPSVLLHRVPERPRFCEDVQFQQKVRDGDAKRTHTQQTYNFKIN